MDIFGPGGTGPPVGTFLRLALAIALGLFVGLERERRGKEAGLRTFAFSALLGGLGGLLGEAYALVALLLLGVLVAFLNWQTLREDAGLELTTSVALLVTGFTGVLCGQGHTFTPVAAAVATAALLAWKERLAGFSLGLTDVEMRSAILLGILAFIVYPVLPAEPLDPWQLIEPRDAWLTVLLIAAIGFVNYVLLKIYGRRGAELSGFLGGLVNSTVTVTELASRVRETEGRMADVAFRGVMLSTAAMVVRNGVLLGLLAPLALLGAGIPLILLLAASLVLVYIRPVRSIDGGEGAPSLRLTSPFSLQSALRFGAIFLGLQVAGSLALSVLGQTGFYVVSVVGGLVSSASAVASAGTLASYGGIPPDVAGTGAVMASLASALVNLPLVSRVSGDRQLTTRLAWSLGAAVGVTLLGIAGLAAAREAGVLVLAG